MKKRILLFTAIAGVTYFTMSSSHLGGAMGSGADGTTATGTTNTCGGCHSSKTTTAVTVEMDDLGVPTTHYVAGHTYTIKISGTNNSTTLNLPKFGFQLTVVKSSGAGTTSAVNAGTFSTTLPANVQLTPKSSFVKVDVIEHTTQIVAATGTGGTGTTYVDSVHWTAPATGAGSLVIYGCINAVDGLGTSSGDAYNSAIPVTITEKFPLEEQNLTSNISIKAFPNPVSNNLNLQLENAQAGNYTVQVYDLGAKIVAEENININGTSQTANINTSKWAPGTYMISVEKDGNRQVIPVVKHP